jgi:hypothetical protein
MGLSNRRACVFKRELRCFKATFVNGVLVVRSQSANRIDELYYKGMGLLVYKRRDTAARAGTKRPWGARRAQRVRGGIGRHKLYRVLLTFLPVTSLRTQPIGSPKNINGLAAWNLYYYLYVYRIDIHNANNLAKY